MELATPAARSMSGPKIQAMSTVANLVQLFCLACWHRFTGAQAGERRMGGHVLWICPRCRCTDLDYASRPYRRPDERVH